MRSASPAVRRLLASCLVWLAFSASAGARQETGALLVARPRAAAELDDVAAGYAAWLHDKFSRAGLALVVPDASQDPGTADAAAFASLRELARRSGASVLVVPELRLHEGMLDVRLVLAGVESGALIAAPQASAPLATPGPACVDTLMRSLERLEIPANALPPAAPPLLDELAASGRALRQLRAGKLGSAWREVEGRLSPTAMALRESILAQAGRPETPLVERARVLAISGDGASAWALLAPELTRGLAAPDPDPQLLLAAAQAQLARGDPRAAGPYLDALLARQPDDAELQLELGRLRMLQSDRDGARAALVRSAELDAASPLPFTLLAEVDGNDPQRQAQHLFAAGRREAARLDSQRAERMFARAIELDPATEAPSLRALGALNQQIGLPVDALAAFDAAREAGDADAEVFAGMGVAQRRLRRPEAEASLRRALTLEPEHGEALRELAAVVAENQRPQEAVGLLERAIALEPQRADTRRALAQALHASGETPRALALLTAKDAPEAASAATLGAAAALHRAQGDLPAARAELLRAVELAPHDAALQRDLAVVAEAQGDAPAARQAKAFAQALEGAPASADPAAQAEASGPSLDELVASFAVQTDEPRKRRVALLGIREPATWKVRALDWLEPKLPDVAKLEATLERALGASFSLEPAPATESPALRSALDDLYAFESERSLSASAIANVIAAVGTDAVFVARLVRHPAPAADPADLAPSCADASHVELEVRMLSGGYKELPSILVDVECLAGGPEAQRVWNARAFAVYAALALLLVFPVVRGWGTIVVTIKLPPRTKGFLRIRISTKPEKVQDAEQEKRERKRAAGRLVRSLRTFSRYVKHMAGHETTFRWIPARTREYVVTVRGPLKDAMNDETIGHFLEEQRVRVLRGQSVKVEYDFCPEDCAVEIVATLAGEPARGARVAVSGDAKSLRYAREGNAFLYLRPGLHTLRVGHQDRACERSVEIDPAKKAMRLTVELGDEQALAFHGCAAAVDPYLQGDLASAAQLLEAAGDSTTASLLRASYHQQRGEHSRAASEFEAAGRLEEAAEMHASGSGFEASAQLFERAGNFARAAETYRAGGDPLAAARCYESAYDYDSALECYEEGGAADQVIELLEKTGAYLDAARRAQREGDGDRAMRNLQLVERRDSAYGEACALMGELLAERGDPELAAGKLAEAIEEAGGENAPVALHERHAALLEQAGQRQQALEAYQTLRRRDPARSDVTQRIASLRREIEASGGDAATRATGAATESRYEIQGELGRGGMGVVFKARDKRLGRVVALKRLPENLRDNKVAVELFLREAQAAAALNHRNIVTVYDAGEEHGVYFITMELLDGLPLNAILEKRGRLSAPDTARLGIQIAAGLQYAHAARIVHRDIKTANLFFTRDRVVKIMDFGLAKTIEEVRRSSTMIGGTPYYMAPEQAAGEAVDHRTDLYAFGVTLFRMVTGAMPFAEGDLAYHHRHTPAPDPRELDASIPDALAELLAKLLAKAPSDRCQSAAEVTAALQSLLPPR